MNNTTVFCELRIAHVVPAGNTGVCTHLLARPSQNCVEAEYTVARPLILRVDSAKHIFYNATKMGDEKKNLYKVFHFIVLLCRREMGLALNN